jgi:hypothetical protein
MKSQKNNLHHYNQNAYNLKTIQPITQTTDQTKSNLQKTLTNNRADHQQKFIQDNLNNTVELISDLYALECL